jgi:hypothetical protein
VFPENCRPTEHLEVKEQLRANAGLEAKTIFAALQRKYPERFAYGATANPYSGK